jgi:hypothetical protein
MSTMKLQLPPQGSKLTTILYIALCGVPFVVSQCLPSGLHARYTYESWDSTALIWRNTAGQGSDATGSGSGFSKACRTNVNGASGRVCEVSGTTASVLRFGTMPTSYTMCTVARYTGTSRQRIFTTDSASKNWFHGFWSSKRGVAYNENWMTSSSNLIPAVETDWLIFCSQNQVPYKYYANDVSVGIGQDQCTGGYASVSGDIANWGSVNGVGGGRIVSSCSECISLCDQQGAACRSTECSPSALRCNLNDRSTVDDTNNYLDYAFCQKPAGNDHKYEYLIP